MLRDYCACGYCGTRRRRPRVSMESVSDARRRTNRDNRYSRRTRIVEENNIDVSDYCDNCESFLGGHCLAILRRACLLEVTQDRGEFN
tara:strand:+ start:696 stop:959 length:264 start_codon:yes stop_codon:yes gene_type:complete